MDFLVLLSIASVAIAHPLTWPLTEAEFNVKSCAKEMLNPFFPYSYENTSAITGHECCFNHDGIFLQTQFWDFDFEKLDYAVNGTNTTSISTNESLFEEGVGFFGIGDWLKNFWNQITVIPSSQMPIEKAFTVHGLWSDWGPDLYQWNEFCQPDLEVDADEVDVRELIGTEFHKPQLLSLLEKYWINTATSNVANDSDIELWTHEYNKHGTCMNTVLPNCFKGEYKQYESAVYFWQKVVDVWDTLNTYEFLSREGIFPTVKHTYKQEDILRALKHGHLDKSVHIGCTSDGALNEIWYYYHIKGSVFTGDYKAVDAVGSNTCPENVWYIPK